MTLPAQHLVVCEWCGYEFLSENACFTEAGHLLDPGCYMTVDDEHFQSRLDKKS